MKRKRDGLIYHIFDIKILCKNEYIPLNKYSDDMIKSGYKFDNEEIFAIGNEIVEGIDEITVFLNEFWNADKGNVDYDREYLQLLYVNCRHIKTRKWDENDGKYIPYE